MITAALVCAALAALLHVYIFVMESWTWTSPRTRAAFGTTAEVLVPLLGTGSILPSATNSTFLNLTKTVAWRFRSRPV